MDRRNFLIKSIGAAIIAGGTPIFLRSLLPEEDSHKRVNFAVTSENMRDYFKEFYASYRDNLIMPTDITNITKSWVVKMEP